MASGGKHLKSLRRRIPGLLNAERSHMCWELGYFQAPMFIQEPGEMPNERKARDVASSPACGLDISCKGRGSISKGDFSWVGMRADMS
jgi:hypothetical protein